MARADAADSSWISWFLSSKGNEYFCEIDDDYILDRFNLTGLNTEVQNYSQAFDLITDNFGACGRVRCREGFDARVLISEEEFPEEVRASLEVQARFLYGLIHARWIITSRGLAKMVSNVHTLFNPFATLYLRLDARAAACTGRTRLSICIEPRAVTT